jgi:branched-chain amino acid transport system ATP-binding protein
VSLLEVQDLQVAYGEIRALKGVSFRVEAGEIVALLGNNGAGKTTTLKALSGLLAPRAGTIALDGASLAGLPAHEVVRRGVTHVPEGRHIFNRLTVLDNLEMGAYIRTDGEVAADMERVFAVFPRLKERRTQVAGTLSGGEQQMLAIGRGLMTNPDCLIMDEPSEGLAPIIIQGVWEAIAKLKEEGLSILLVEQNASLALKLVDYVHVMSKGQVVYSARPDELWANSEIKSSYLGI